MIVGACHCPSIALPKFDWVVQRALVVVAFFSHAVWGNLASFLYLQRTDAYKAMLAKRRKLPAWENQDKILDALYDNQVIVISGMTG